MEHRSLHKLADFLRAHADVLLNNEGTSPPCKLSLTTRSLVGLSKQLSILLQNEQPESDSFSARGCDANSTEMHDLLFVHDVLQKVARLKLITSPSTIEGEMSLARFTSLKQLELQRVPPHLVTPMRPAQAGDLEVLEAHRCLTEVKALLNLSGGAPWSRVQTLRLSHNRLDSFEIDRRSQDEGREPSEYAVEADKQDWRLNPFGPLNQDVKYPNSSPSTAQLLPALRNLDLSHNVIRELDLSQFELLSCVDLSFNFISKIPRFHLRAQKITLSHLCVRNNLIEDLRGLEALTALHVLDLGHNMISDFNVLHPLANLQELDRLILEGNPIALHKDYHKNVASYITKTVILDDTHDVHSERTSVLTTTGPVTAMSINGDTIDSSRELPSAEELERIPSLIDDGRTGSSISSRRTPRTRDAVIRDIPIDDTESAACMERILAASNARIAAELKERLGSRWLVAGGEALQLPTAQSTPVPEPRPALPTVLDESTIFQAELDSVTSRCNAQQKLDFSRKESRQSDDCRVITDEDAPCPVDLATGVQEETPRGADPVAAISAAVLMTENGLHEVDKDSPGSLTPSSGEPAAAPLNESDKEESPAIGVVDAEPPEINDEDIEALADTSDGTFLSAHTTPTRDSETQRSSNLNEAENRVSQNAEVTETSNDPSFRRSLTSIAGSDRLEQDSAVWARLRETRRNTLKYDLEHSMAAEDKLFLECGQFKNDESFRAACRCFIVLRENLAFEGFVIISNQRIYLSMTRVSESSGGLVWSAPLSKLSQITTQCKSQSLLIEVKRKSAKWESAGSSGTPPRWFLAYVGDAAWCGQLAEAFSDHMPATAALNKSAVDSADYEAQLSMEDSKGYTQAYWRILEDDNTSTMEGGTFVCIALDLEGIVVFRERHVEPEKVAYTEVCRQTISAVTSLALEENDPRIAHVTFALDETGSREQVWLVRTASAASMIVFIESLAESWQMIFDVELPLSYV